MGNSFIKWNKYILKEYQNKGIGRKILEEQLKKGK